MKPEELKVFCSSITRGSEVLQNNLHDLINVVPAKTAFITTTNEVNDVCDFRPTVEKHYVPKKRNKLKVKTVRDIRHAFEKDIYSYLPEDLERQQSILLKKITDGSANNLNTKTLAQKILKSDNPISRSAWQMLMNINPNDHTNSSQYVLWNSKRIRLNGSRGGRNKFLCNYDLASNKLPKINKSLKYKPYIDKKKGLLRNSLAIKFKPGPLTRKKYLDDSYQKYNVGNTDLIELPKIGLDIKPTYGVVLEPPVLNVLQNYRNIDGVISEKWAEFSASVLGSVTNEECAQIVNKESVTFDLCYQANQRRILMRQDVCNQFVKDVDNSMSTENLSAYNAIDIMPEISSVLSDILDSVEISLHQNDMFSGEDEIREVSNEDLISPLASCSHNKDKTKRKLNELDRLDVTIIRIPDASSDERNIPCQKSYCSLGCICNSLKCNYTFKQHCGNADCMFECKCDFMKYRITDTLENDCHELLPGLLNLDNEINLRLAKEEQKFHQTVVVTSDKSILLKSEKRNWKASKRYSDFYSNMSLKSEIKCNKVLSVAALKLNCDNIEQWCMVHNLYKCFCSGKFTEKSISDKVLEVTDNTEKMVHKTIEKNNTENIEIPYNKPPLKQISRPERSRAVPKKYSTLSETSDITEEEYVDTSARVTPYEGRKYKICYYLATNLKIAKMEQNDTKLYKRLLYLIAKSDKSYKSKTENECVDNEVIPENVEQTNAEVESNTTPAQSLQVKSKLMRWLETSYKQYKERVEQGITKSSLDPPKQGKLALYPWEFILTRYRERKNLFMISKEKPYRIFMAVNTSDAFFSKCINIDDIRFANLHQYPITIKNLLTNATDIKNTFFILCGLPCCWELIGSVKKIDDSLTSAVSQLQTKTETSCDSKEIDSKSLDIDDKINETDDVMFDWEEEAASDSETDTNIDTSRWFVMTVEKDFCEIQFYKRGFFVKYESIIKAINVARMSGKTVRLSAQKCSDQNSTPIFGLYAIPNAHEYCVFIGPYDKNEPLGIETVKSLSHVNTVNKTRGVWMTTKKIDNMKVIDNPLSFMPPDGYNIDPSKYVSLEGDLNEQHKHIDNESNDQSNDSNRKESVQTKKSIRPIKIRKSNGFYHLAPRGFLKPVSNYQSNNSKSLLINITTKNLDMNMPCPQITNSSTSAVPIIKVQPNLIIECTPRKSKQKVETTKKPVAEIAPQIKIIGVYSQGEPASSNEIQTKRSEGGMFILKPEEINKRLMLNPDICNDFPLTQNNAENHTDEDIERFLATSEVCDPPNADVYVISDDEDEPAFNNHIDVWIECANVDNLGWLKGRRNAENEISFEFPGFKFTDFYNEEEAFAKINQVLSRKIYIPKNLKLEWRVVDSEDQLKTKTMLATDKLGTDYVLTKRGPRHKSVLMKPSLDIATPSHSKTNTKDLKTNETSASPFAELDKYSATLENECDVLMSEFIKKGPLIRSFCNKSSIVIEEQSLDNLNNASLPTSDEMES